MPQTSSAAEARTWFEPFGQQDFGAHWNAIRPLCINEAGWPFGIMHIGHFDGLETPHLESHTADELAIAYVYLATCFFCMDHLYDHESKNDFEILATSLCLERATARISNALQKLNLDVSVGHIEIAKLLHKFTEAMVLERKIKSSIELHDESLERSHTIGRSWLVIFAYRLIQQIKGRPVVVQAQALLEEGIYLLQLGDDWGDWREDFRSGNWNTFLRRCFFDIGRLPKHEGELERYIYLSGAYEQQGRMISRGLKKVASGLAKIYGQRGRGFNSVIELCRARADAVVQNFERVKRGLPPLPIPGAVQ